MTKVKFKKRIKVFFDSNEKAKLSDSKAEALIKKGYAEKVKSSSKKSKKSGKSKEDK